MSNLNLRTYPVPDVYAAIKVDRSADVLEVSHALATARSTSTDQEYWDDVELVLLNPFVNEAYQSLLTKRSPALADNLDKVLTADRLSRSLYAPEVPPNGFSAGLQQAAVRLDIAKLLSPSHVATFLYTLQETGAFADLDTALQNYGARQNPYEFDVQNADHRIALAAVWPRDEAAQILKDCLHDIRDQQLEFVQAAIVLGVAQRMAARGEISEFQVGESPTLSSASLGKQSIDTLRDEAEDDMPWGFRMGLRSNDFVEEVLGPRVAEIGNNPYFRALAADWARAGYPKGEPIKVFEPWAKKHPTTFDVPEGMVASPLLDVATNREQFGYAAEIADYHDYSIVVAAAALVAMQDALTAYEVLPADDREKFVIEALWMEHDASGTAIASLAYEEFANLLQPVEAPKQTQSASSAPATRGKYLPPRQYFDSAPLSASDKKSLRGLLALHKVGTGVGVGVPAHSAIQALGEHNPAAALFLGGLSVLNGSFIAPNTIALLLKLRHKPGGRDLRPLPVWLKEAVITSAVHMVTKDSAPRVEQVDQTLGIHFSPPAPGAEGLAR